MNFVNNKVEIQALEALWINKVISERWKSLIKGKSFVHMADVPMLSLFRPIGVRKCQVVVNLRHYAITLNYLYCSPQPIKSSLNIWSGATITKRSVGRSHEKNEWSNVHSSSRTFFSEFLEVNTQLTFALSVFPNLLVVYMATTTRIKEIKQFRIIIAAQSITEIFSSLILSAFSIVSFHSVTLQEGAQLTASTEQQKTAASTSSDFFPTVVADG